MDTIQLRQTSSPRMVERRRRWNKRRNYDRAYKMSGVDVVEFLAVQPGSYRTIDICDCIPLSAEHCAAKEAAAEPMQPPMRSLKEVKA